MEMGTRPRANGQAGPCDVHLAWVTAQDATVAGAGERGASGDRIDNRYIGCRGIADVMDRDRVIDLAAGADGDVGVNLANHERGYACRVGHRPGTPSVCPGART